MSKQDARRSALTALASEMASEDLGRNAPVRTVFALIGDRWTPLILAVLATGTWRHAELRRTVEQLAVEGKISQRVLTLKLRALERNGFLRREVSQAVPPSVHYSLTPLGQALFERCSGLLLWIKAMDAEISAARQRFDAKL